MKMMKTLLMKRFLLTWAIALAALITLVVLATSAHAMPKPKPKPEPQGVAITGRVVEIQIPISRIGEATGGKLNEYVPEQERTIVWTFTCLPGKCSSLRIGRSATLYCLTANLKYGRNGIMTDCESR